MHEERPGVQWALRLTISNSSTQKEVWECGCVGKEDKVTPEAIGFLSAVGVFVVLLAILFLFINKKLCFARVGGLPCFEHSGRRKRKDRAGIHQGLDAIKDSFLSLAPKPTPSAGPQVTAEDGYHVDASSLEPEERLLALQAQLALRGLDPGSEAGPLERLTPISEEAEELESKVGDSTSRRGGTVNSYGDDGEVTSSSDSEDDIVKRFEISVSRSQSFRSGVTEAQTQSVPGRHHKFQRLEPDQEEGSTEPSDCEGPPQDHHRAGSMWVVDHSQHCSDTDVVVVC
ncbi:hypothetical protein NFI96_003153 [Prochilodus magdalenae]|nr:hypothetical protein NFI96_003153 [Prochilodus magdalenae]